MRSIVGVSEKDKEIFAGGGYTRSHAILVNIAWSFGISLITKHKTRP